MRAVVVKEEWEPKPTGRAQVPYESSSESPNGDLAEEPVEEGGRHNITRHD